MIRTRFPDNSRQAETRGRLTPGVFGGTQQALAAGVPVIVAGVTEDKPAVAARIAHHGLGIDLHTATPSPEARSAGRDLASPAAAWLA